MSPPNDSPREPRAFDLDDPRVARATPRAEAPETGPHESAPHRPRAERKPEAPAVESEDAEPAAVPTIGQRIERGIGWLGWLVSAMVGLAVLAAGVWFARFISVAIERQDWVGWLSLGLLGLAALATVVLVLREIVGLFRLGRLGRLRRDADLLVATPDIAKEREFVRRLLERQKQNPTAGWAVAAFAPHMGDVHDQGALLALADRELIRPIDTQARAAIFTSARRIATVTALSPIATLTVGYVLIENLRLMRVLAGLYGGRPGVVGGLKLARNVVLSLIASGGVAFTDDLLGQFLGQDILRRLSRRLGEGAFNGALTARLGAATVEIVRPLPYIEAPKIRARDIINELFKSMSLGKGK